MIKVESSQVTEYEVHRFVTEASTIGLPPGPMPDTLRTSMGNGLHFVKWSHDDSGSLYRQAAGCIWLRVHND